MPDYRQADLDEARATVSGLTSKQYERIARALAARERKGAASLYAKVNLFLERSAELGDEDDTALLIEFGAGDPAFRDFICLFSECAREWQAELLGGEVQRD